MATVKCPNAAVGDTGVVNGVQYTERDRVEMEFRLEQHGSYCFCLYHWDH